MKRAFSSKQQPENYFNICIVGAGAAGLYAAVTAAESDCRTAIIEKNTAAGRKLQITGGGRCNLTHLSKPNEFLTECSPYSRFLRHCIYELPPEKVIDFFNSKGIRTSVDGNGCVFTANQNAAELRDMLVKTANEMNVKFFYDKPVEKIEKEGSEFLISYSSGRIIAKSVIVATGGLSYPKTGSTGDGLTIAKHFGHTNIATRPSLVPLITKEKWVGSLAGVSIKDAALLIAGERRKHGINGAIVFTGEGIGGPAVLNFSRKILPLLAGGSVDIIVDLFPSKSADELIIYLNSLCEQNPKESISGLFKVVFPRSLIIQLARMTGIEQSLKASNFSRKNRIKFVSLVKSLPLAVIDTKEIEFATVTTGGVDNSEINGCTMESKLCEGLYFAGEVIDADGPCGGYNLQIAFSTGSLAAKSAVLRVLQEK